MSRRRHSVAMIMAVTSLTASAASPSLSGLHRVEGIGLVDVTEADGQLVGRLKRGAACDQLEPNGVVVTGVFEGALFAGAVTVCQAGAGCAPVKRHPFLGFWVDDVLVGTVKADPGCSVVGLSRGSMHVTPATEDERAAVGEGARAPGAEVTSVEAAITDGTSLVKDGRYTEALVVLRDAQALDPDNVSLLYLTGVAHAALQQPKQAAEPLRRAATVARARKLSPRLVGELHFRLACALAQEKRSREAVEALTQGFDYAGESGFTLDDLLKNPDLAPIRRERDFQALTARVRLASKPKGKSPR